MKSLQKENVIDIPVENTPYNLFIYSDGWGQVDIKPANIVDAGLIEDLGVNYMLYCSETNQKNFVRDKKKDIAKGHGYSTWTQMLSERDKTGVTSFYEKLIKNIIEQ